MTSTDTTSQGQQPASAVAAGSADWQAQCDALIEETRKNVAMPSDACVMLSLAAKVLLARREIDRLRKDSEVLTAILDVANPPTGHGKQ